MKTLNQRGKEIETLWEASLDLSRDRISQNSKKAVYLVH